MKRIALGVFAMLVVLIGTQAQENLNRNENKFVATVVQLKGVCYVRDSEASRPRPLKSNYQLHAGQGVSCKRGSHLKILFRASSDEREIKTILPKWFEIGNVLTPKHLLSAKKSELEPAVREKHGGEGSSIQTVIQQGVRPNPVQNSSKLANNVGIDEADLFWRGRPKYFLVVAASQTSGVQNNLDFTKVDAQLVSQNFTASGYEKLNLLDDKTATRDNFVEQLHRVRTLPQNAIVVVYYSGHAVKDPQDKNLWLQLSEQTGFGDTHGLSLSDLVGAARGDSYKGDLVIILDSCYSGQGTVTSQLSIREADKTVIFASSASYQKSYSVLLPSDSEMSAFTYYLLRGLDADWTEVDGDSDGIILYSDLQSYIQNKLIELLRDQGIPGPMQPQLFGQSPDIWAAYDSRQARNRETQAWKTLRLRRLIQVQDPEKITALLQDPLPANADSYSRALIAIKTRRFDEAWRLLSAAESENKVHLAQINWTRAYLKVEQRQPGPALDWAEKALSMSPQRNLDLIWSTAVINFRVGNWTRAERLFKEELGLIGDVNTDNEELISSLYFLTILNAIQGNKAEAGLYLTRLKKIDPKSLDDEGAGFLTQFREALSDLLEDKPESAKRKMEELGRSIATSKGNEQEVLRSLRQTVDALLIAADSNDIIVSVDKLREWNESIQNRNVNLIILFLNQLQLAALGPASMDALRSPQVDDLLKRTVDLARRHTSETQNRATQGQTETSEIELADSREQVAVESALVLIGAATIYTYRRDIAEAENLLKEAIKLVEKKKDGADLSMFPVTLLGALYVDASRSSDAENLYKSFLMQLREPLGEQHMYVSLIYKQLGILYEDWERWEEAEQSYRKALEAQSEEGLLFDDGQETLATFLHKRGRYAEAIALFEKVIHTLEQKRNTAPLLTRSLGEDYFRLATDYSQLGRHALAGKTFQKAAEFFSSKQEPNLIDNLSCLVWQWFTADALKKPDEANRFYQRIVKLTESDLAGPHPNESLGANLQNFAYLFIDGREYPQAEQLLRLALAIEEKAYGPETPEVAQAWESLAYLARARSKYAESIVSLNKAYQIYEKRSPLELGKLIRVLYWIGFAKYQRQEFEEARGELKRSLDIVQQVPELSRPDHRRTKYLLGEVQRLLGQYSAAAMNLRSVVDSIEGSQRDASVFWDRLAQSLLKLAAISRSQGNRAEAEEWLRRAQVELDKPAAAKCISCFAMMRHERGMLASSKTKEAEQLLRESVDKADEAKMPPVLIAEYVEDYAAVLRQRKKNTEAAQLELRAKQLRNSLRDNR